MKNNLAPTFAKPIGDNYILWFKSTNNYIIIDGFLMSFVEIFTKVKDKIQFIQEITQSEKFSEGIEKAQAIYNAISNFLEDQNTPNISTEVEEVPFENSFRNYHETYQIDTHTLEIYYASEAIKELIHPKIMHLANTVESTKKAETIFDIYDKGNNFYLFKNNCFVVSFEKSNYHLLQGRFSMELLCVLYNKQENDWLGTFHASTVSNGIESIMLVGDSGNGKSTFSALLMAAGLNLIADDITPILAENGHVYSYPSAISIKQGAFEILDDYYPNFKNLKSFESGTKKGLLKYIPPKKFKKKSKRHLPCTKIVYVKYDKKKVTKLTKSSPKNILPTLIPESWISPKQENAKQFLNWLEDVSYYELIYNDNSKAISTFMKLL
ncbi:hypothetical protein ACFQ5N_03245 [Lutibacter holmesii]|uniref:Serine kinase n=1 Tax=Lutibacter holmesii TaxID=1137985 RepID=A0ABW3WLR0_9FLAO